MPSASPTYQVVCPDCYPNPIPSLEARRRRPVLRVGDRGRLRPEGRV